MCLIERSDWWDWRGGDIIFQYGGDSSRDVAFPERNSHCQPQSVAQAVIVLSVQVLQFFMIKVLYVLSYCGLD